MKMPKPIAKAKDKWDQQPKSKKKGIIIIALSVLAIIVLAIVITAIINASKPGYKVLYSGLDPKKKPRKFMRLCRRWAFLRR